MKIKIFYHAFLENRWRDIFECHLNHIIESKLYENIVEMKIVAIWKTETELQILRDIVKPYKKIKLSDRFFWDTPPFQIHRVTHRIGRTFTKKEKGGEKFEIQIGESETALKLLADAKENEEDVNYLFLHTKSTSSPCLVRHLDTRYDELESIPLTQQTKGGMRIAKGIIGVWADAVQKLETCDWRGPRTEEQHAPVFGTQVNFWWIHSRLAKRFDLQKISKVAIRRNTKTAKRESPAGCIREAIISPPDPPSGQDYKVPNL